MSHKPKRRWYQFSLIGLLLVVTMFCLLFGRIDYLKRKSAFHLSEMYKHVERIQQRKGLTEDDALGFATLSGPSARSTGSFGPPEGRFQLVLLDDDDTRAVRHHYRLAEEFEAAVSRPWVIVDESKRIAP